MERKLVTKRDIIIILLILALAVGLLLFRFFKPVENVVAVITVDGIETKKINLSDVTEEQTISLDNGIEIKAYNHCVRFYESDCKDKICVHSGELCKTGDVAACLPNKTVISVVSSDNSAIDIMTY